MGLAHQAPYDSYERTYFVSENTIERFRELLSGENHPDAQRLTRDLGNRLDLAVQTEMKNGDIRRFVFEKEGEKLDQMAVDISSHFNGVPVVAVVGANIKTRRSSPDLAIITVNTKGFLHMLDKKEKATLGDVVGDKLRSISVDPAPSRTGPLPANVAPRGAPKEMWVVRALDPEGAVEHHDVLAGDVKAFVEKLITEHDCDPSGIMVFKPVKMQAKVQVTVDFE